MRRGRRTFIPNPTLYQRITHHPYFKPFAAWFAWMFIGAIFYSVFNDLSISKGFYMAVNVGYSIGWGYPNEIDDLTRVFSTIYILIGASAVAASLAFFADSMIDSSQDWYATALEQEKLKHARTSEKIVAWLHLNQNPLVMIGCWILMVVFLLIWSYFQIGWGWSQSVYFSIGSLSTGGLWAMPVDSPDWYYGLVALVTAVGVPLMGIAMAHFSSMFLVLGDPEKAQKQIEAKVTEKELEMMKRLQLDDGDGEISRAEYILLCAVRIGALSPDLISKINYRFHFMDTSGDGAVDYSEITHIHTEVIVAPKYSLTDLLQHGYLQEGVQRVSL